MRIWKFLECRQVNLTEWLRTQFLLKMQQQIYSWILFCKNGQSDEKAFQCPQKSNNCKKEKQKFETVASRLLCSVVWNKTWWVDRSSLFWLCAKTVHGKNCAMFQNDCELCKLWNWCMVEHIFELLMALFKPLTKWGSLRSHQRW